MELGEIETINQKFRSSKSPIAIPGVDIDKILIDLTIFFILDMENMASSILSATKMMKKLIHCVLTFQQRMDV